MGTLDKFNKKIEIKNEKQIKAIIILMISYYWMMYLYDVLCYVPNGFFNILVDVVLHFIVVMPVFFVYCKVGLYKESIDIKNKKQYIYVIPCALIFFAACYVVFGLDFDSDAYVILDSGILWLFIYFFFVVALTEEFVFRVYFLGELSVVLGKAKWLAPMISGVFFGVIHWVNMGYDSAWMNIIIGVVLGYAKMYLKNCTFITCVLANGLYDFIITITGW